MNIKFWVQLPLGRRRDLPVHQNEKLKFWQVADLDVTDLVSWRPRIPFCAADALWGGVTHTFGQIAEHVDSVLNFGVERAL